MNDWRLPTLAELQTTVVGFTCTGTGEGPRCICGLTPCIDGTFGPTQFNDYWSATSYVPYYPGYAWLVYFGDGSVDIGSESFNFYVRAVRGSL